MMGRTRKTGFGQMIFCFMSVFMLFLILKNSDTAIDYMTQGMKLCTTTVIPSLFPFMVVSELIVRSGVSSVLSKPLRPFMTRLFGVSGECGPAFLLGTLCGFPIGAASAVGLWREGRITKDELSRIINFSNNPSSAFVINAVGLSLFGSRKFGTALYFLTLLSAVSVGIFWNIFDKLKGRQEKSVTLPVENGQKIRKLGISSLTEAITRSALGILNVCAFVIFFCAFVGTLGYMLDAFGLSDTVRALFFSFFEMTGGVSASSGVAPIETGALISAFALGWSGLSVHFQVIAMCDGTDIRTRRYFISKFIQGLLNVLYLWLYLRFFGESIVFGAESVTAFDYTAQGSVKTAACGAFIAALILAFVKRKKIPRYRAVSQRSI